MRKPKFMMALVAIFVVCLPVMGLLAAPPSQNIGPIPTSATEIRDAFEGYTTDAWVVTIILFLIVWGIVYSKWPRGRGRPGRRSETWPMIGGIVAGLIVVVIVAPPLCGALGLVGVTYGPEESTLNLTSPITFTVKDKYGATAVDISGDKLYWIKDSSLFNKDAFELYDLVRKGKITAQQALSSDVDSNGQATFDMQAGTWLLFYYPGSSITLGTTYAPAVFTARTYEDVGTAGRTVKAESSILYVVKTSALSFVDEVGNSKSSYTIAPSSYPLSLIHI